MATSTFSVRMDPEVKRQLDQFCSEVGMTTSTAVNLFARAVIREQKLPFDIEAPRLNKTELIERTNDFAQGKNIVSHDLIEPK